MRIAIIGGHGKVAMLLSPLLGEHEVSAVIRNPQHASEVEQTGARPVVADVQDMSTEDLAELLGGHDVVVWSAGAGGGDPERTYAVDRDAATRTMDAAEQAGVGRYLMVSYLGARRDHGVPEDNAFFAYAEAKSAADQHLRDSGLGWTIVAPGQLSLDEPTGSIEVRGSGPGSDPQPSDGSELASVPRADVAAVIAAVVGREDLTGRMIEFVGGDTPIDQALDEVAKGA
ncbi:NAD-dependent dehydratase [Serinicoccus sp. CUA-874]|uniref:SDR family oxidoreductase n=1 Tax=Serinicoccus sp. CUA-874 TaxID=1517939 RepID=UPI000967B784|nr:SDR family oxidoreductase [Serinicoccus sp. CUA-874]OLT16802.1 NAD-dependent dehydratase [Serinicoccus sp. CUA-874]